MIIEVCTMLQNGGEVWINQKGYEEIEIEPAEIGCLSESKTNRYIGLGKRGVFRLTAKSWTKLRKELNRLGLLTRLDLSHN